MLELLYPPSCLSCASRLPTSTPLELCADCERQLHAVPPPCCPRCGRHSAVSLLDGDVCPSCRHALPSFRAGAAAFEYAGALRDCIHRVKFDSHLRLARALGDRLAQAAHARLRASGYDLIIPVPLHPARRRDRGFNQAEMLARPISAALQLPMELGVLRRVRRTETQSRLAPLDRHENVAGAFHVQHASRIAGQHILLVDDVLTTGATAEACSQSLLAAGARSVDVLVLATN